MREAANAACLKRNFAGDDRLHVPDVYWDLCRDNVMVMERIYGTPIGDITRLRELGVDFRKLAENGVAIFFTQVFRHNFFHADMHPGNIFVLTEDPVEPRYAEWIRYRRLLDARDQESSRRISSRCSIATTGASPRCTWSQAGCRKNPRRGDGVAIRTICEPIFDRP